MPRGSGSTVLSLPVSPLEAPIRRIVTESGCRDWATTRAATASSLTRCRLPPQRDWKTIDSSSETPVGEYRPKPAISHCRKRLRAGSAAMVGVVPFRALRYCPASRPKKSTHLVHGGREQEAVLVSPLDECTEFEFPTLAQPCPTNKESTGSDVARWLGHSTRASPYMRGGWNRNDVSCHQRDRHPPPIPAFWKQVTPRGRRLASVTS